ncbi:MAG: tetraacyldisaccharide 4'-kinase [Acidobacteriota bacterium]
MPLVLGLLSRLYGMIVWIRAGLYSRGILATRHLRCPVISVGNLTMGGAGKTPAVIALGKILQAGGLRVSVLLRGYKGKHRGGPLLVSDGVRITSSAVESGDEAQLLAKRLPGAVVVVSKDRAKGGAWVENQLPVDVHLLDDGYQHLGLHRDLNVLLIDTSNPITEDSLFPLGRLREPLSGVRRSDLVVLTRVRPGAEHNELVSVIRSHHPHLRQVTSGLTFSGATIYQEGKAEDVSGLEGTVGVAVAGIACPGQFFDCLENWGVRLLGRRAFPDHHRYRAQDVERIQDDCRRFGAEVVLMTEKDAENCDVFSFSPLKVMVVRVELKFADEAAVRELLNAAIQFRNNVPSS